MATAKFPATLVIEAADARLTALREARSQKAKEWIDNYMKVERSDGSLWWRRTYFATRDQAEAEYIRHRGMMSSHKYWEEYLERESIAKIEPLRRLAMAANDNNPSGTVNLSACECDILKLRGSE